ncbi:MAG: DUF4922 domain-containing protein [Bacteroidales bacterium]|nr:DUF4922 domain-containing protein [Bacteroidales bacterium]
MKNKETIYKFVGDQLSRWPLACDNFRALKSVETRPMVVGGLEVVLQHNPARIISSAAKTDAASLKKRRCFLCREHRPPEQIFLPFEGRKGKKYDILVNPYPIFPEHLVIACETHQEQSIWHRFIDILDLSARFPGYTFFYNGPKCGASAPDHHHFQATRSGLMPLEADVDRELDSMLLNKGNAREIAEDTVFDYMTAVQDAKLYHYRRFLRGIFVIKSKTAKSAAKMFYRFLDTLPLPEGDGEPRFNLITYCKKGEYRTIVILRTTHRSHHYHIDGPEHLTMSPGCADMGGVLIASVREDYEKMTPELLAGMLQEVTFSEEMEADLVKKLSRKQPVVEVGIMSGKEIEFEVFSDGAGVRKAVLKEGKIEYGGSLYDELYFGEQTLSTQFAEPSFKLYGVTIGVDFHWERKEDQVFAGALKIIVHKGELIAVNVVGVEDYLMSVISSEMSSSASEEFLKAHAVISRSWLMAQINSSGKGYVPGLPENMDNVPALVTWLEDRNRQDLSVKGRVYEYIKWYDHEDHRLFDVCADDHCQRYQGLTRVTGTTVRKVIDATWGQVLMYDGELCDTRFSKCCGGVMERFDVCWADEDKPYLQALPDAPGHSADGHCFCDTDDKDILAQVLNNYDRETVDFYRWQQEYSKAELSAIVSEKSGIGVGDVMALIPIERGASGRIHRLEIRCSAKTLIVGKELEIRRLLSKTHLKSSAFEVEYIDAEGRETDAGGDWETIRLKGKGWGHGVGLCQIGAAVMASKGYTYKEILEHYYPGAVI